MIGDIVTHLHNLLNAGRGRGRGRPGKWTFTKRRRKEKEKDFGKERRVASRRAGGRPPGVLFIAIFCCHRRILFTEARQARAQNRTRKIFSIGRPWSKIWDGTGRGRMCSAIAQQSPSSFFRNTAAAAAAALPRHQSSTLFVIVSAAAPASP